MHETGNRLHPRVDGAPGQRRGGGCTKETMMPYSQIMRGAGFAIRAQAAAQEGLQQRARDPVEQQVLKPKAC
jgi:hypothetical protein